MRRIAGLAVILTVVLPAVFAYAAAFNITYSGSSVFVVPIEDVVTTEQIGGPTTQRSVASSPSVMLYTGDSAQGATCQGGEDCDDQVEPEPESEEVEVLSPVVEEPTPAPTPTPRAPQTPRLAGGGGR